MLRKLIEFLKNNHPDSNIDEFLDAKYIKLNDAQLKQIADAIKSEELKIKPASNCTAQNFILHFGSTIVLMQRDNSNSDAIYKAELAWETDFLSNKSIRDKIKGFYFISFEIDNNYQTTLKNTDKKIKNQIINAKKNQDIVDKVMPILKAFMSAIS